MMRQCNCYMIASFNDIVDFEIFYDFISFSLWVIGFHYFLQDYDFRILNQELINNSARSTSAQQRSGSAAPRSGVGLNELLGNIARIPQRKTQHVKELYSVLEDWLRVVLDKEVTVNACNPKTMPLVESELIAERAGAHL